MNNYNFFINVLYVISLCIALLTETTSWSIRSFSRPEFSGIYIAKTNIYLYGARLFLLIYTAGLAYLVDKKEPLETILMLVSTSYIVASLMHIFILNSHVHQRVCLFLIKLLLIKKEKTREVVEIKNTQKNLVINTSLSTIFFSIAMAAPYAVATVLPDMRMTVGAIGQIINSVGTVILLFMVDPILYRLMDENLLMENLRGYLVGRVMGFMIGGLLILAVGLSFGNSKH